MKIGKTTVITFLATMSKSVYFCCSNTTSFKVMLSGRFFFFTDWSLLASLKLLNKSMQLYFSQLFYLAPSLKPDIDTVESRNLEVL